MNLLLVEPDAVLASSYQAGLQQAGHQVRTVRTAQAAIDAVDNQQPDAIVLEMQLVSHSGIEFLYELRSYQEWQAIPVLILSLVPPAEFSTAWPELHDTLGVEQHLYKPHTTLAALCQAVAKLAPVTA